jgi:hypothetical protein
MMNDGRERLGHQAEGVRSLDGYLRKPSILCSRPPSTLALRAPTTRFTMGKNTIFSGKLTKMKIQATVINDIWPELLFFTFVSFSG